MKPLDCVAPESESIQLWQRFSVSYEYQVCFTRALFDPANPVFRDALSRLEPQRRQRFIVFVDAGLCAAQPTLVERIGAYVTAHAAQLDLIGEPILVPGGERIKTDLHFVESMQRAVFEHRLDRHAFVVGIGGGALLDAVGLVAATSHRGIRHVRVPTTVLAQNDSGVGVKNGVNLHGAKNYVGTFAPPFAVLNDLDFVQTLPDRDKIAGMAEAVKVALIRDGAFFAWLERNADRLALFDSSALGESIRRCAELHMHQIAHGGDPFESGSARPLDYGHWVAHKIESLTEYHVRHGEAVAIGLALDARYSVLSGLLEPGAEERIGFLLEHLGFRLFHPVLEQRDRDGQLRVLRGLDEFREHLGGELTITLLEAIGVGIEVHEMDTRRVAESIEWLRLRSV